MFVFVVWLKSENPRLTGNRGFGKIDKSFRIFYPRCQSDRRRATKWHYRQSWTPASLVVWQKLFSLLTRTHETLFGDVCQREFWSGE
jgi:hypothetical protein